MWQRFRNWLLWLPYRQGIERQQAVLIQTVESCIFVIGLLCIPLPSLIPMDKSGQIAITLLFLIISSIAGLALWLLRSGRSQASVLLISITLTLLCGILIYTRTLRHSEATLFALAVPITMAGLITRRRGLALILATSIGSVISAALLELVGAPGSGIAAGTASSPLIVALSFTALALLMGMFIDQMRTILREALEIQHTREHELEELYHNLELTVRDRTADLEMALDNLEFRAADQQRLLAENNRQQAIIRDLSVPVLPISATTLVMPLVGALDGERLLIVQDRALAAIERAAARRLLLDVTGVPLIDSYVAQGLIRTLQSARLLGAEVVLVGVRPEVAQSIVGLGLDLSGMRTYADLQSALGAGQRAV